MTFTIYDDLNPDFETVDDLPGWEPFEPDEYPEVDLTGCEYCGAIDTRPDPDPFGQKRCCDACFNELIGDDRDARPWRCGNDPAAAP